MKTTGCIYKWNRRELQLPASIGTGKLCGQRDGFTLIELLISSAVAIMIVVSAYVCLRAGLEGNELVESRIDMIQKARVAIEMIRADLSGACPMRSGPEFLGMDRKLGALEADNIDFATHHYTPQAPNEGDFCEMSYYLDRHPETGVASLFRRRDMTPDLEPLEGGTREEIVDGIQELRFEYYDGWSWYNEWGQLEGRIEDDQYSLFAAGNLDGMPDAVRITIMLEADSGKKEPGDTESGQPPLAFQSVVHLNLAARARSDSYSASGSSEAVSGNGESDGGNGGRP